jgi:hypothetical protein
VDLVTLAQVITSITNLLFVIVLAAGYYFTWRVSQTTLQEMRSQRTAMGRPLVIVQEDSESLPELDVAIRNVSEGAARDIEFEFSAPIESSNGFVVSDLPYFKYGLDFLPPQGEITCYWDELDSLLPYLESKNLQNGIHVTVRYRDLSDALYQSQWRLNPFLYKDTNVPPQHAKELTERIPGSRLRLYPGEGHISVLDRPLKEIVETLLAP